MKKVLAVIMAVLLLFVFSISAFAVPSSSGEEKFSIKITDYSTGKAVTYTKDLVKGETFEIKAADSKYPFIEHIIYKGDGETVSVSGVDYELVSGTLKDKTIIIKPMADIVIVDKYDCEPGKGNEGEKSPEMGFPLMAVFTVAALAGIVCLISKKKAFN